MKKYFNKTRSMKPLKVDGVYHYLSAYASIETNKSVESIPDGIVVTEVEKPKKAEVKKEDTTAPSASKKRTAKKKDAKTEDPESEFKE